MKHPREGIFHCRCQKANCFAFVGNEAVKRNKRRMALVGVGCFDSSLLRSLRLGLSCLTAGDDGCGAAMHVFHHVRQDLTSSLRLPGLVAVVPATGSRVKREHFDRMVCLQLTAALSKLSFLHGFRLLSFYLYVSFNMVSKCYTALSVYDWHRSLKTWIGLEIVSMAPIFLAHTLV
jgi:hypothetical protein